MRAVPTPAIAARRRGLCHETMEGKRARSPPAEEQAADSAGPPTREVYPCTHDLGYVRQDVYACRRCSYDDRPAGFCSSCRIACHGEHLDQVFDLYSKRGFRCDCGNDRTRNTCCLDPDKEPENPENAAVYSHNFEGLYCRCKRGYDPALGDMNQCFMCEDWFHSPCHTPIFGLAKNRTARTIKRGGFELSCSSCVASLPILRAYYPQHGKYVPKKLALMPFKDPAGYPPRPAECTRPTTVPHDMPSVDILWQPGFRQSLCTCTACKIIYEEAHALYVVDPADVPGAVADDSSRVEDADAVLDGTSDGEIVNDVRLESQEEREEKRQRLAADATIQRGIQERIANFLERCMEKDGAGLSHKVVREYLNDVKTEVLSNMDREASANDMQKTP